MSKSIGGIQVRSVQDIQRLPREKQTILETIKENEDLYQMERAVEVMRKDEMILKKLYVAYGNMSVCDIISLIRKRMKEIEGNERYQRRQTAKKALQFDYKNVL